MLDVREALGRLGIRRLVLAIHDASFPSLTWEDTGRGTPYAEGGRRFLRFVRDLGFDAVQLGPSGQTTLGNPSPYDGTLFSRNVLSVALGALAEDPAWEGLLPRETLARLVDGRPDDGGRVAYDHVWHAHRRALGDAWAAFRAPGRHGLDAALRAFRSGRGGWLERDACFEALAAEHGTDDWQRWPEPDRRLFCPAPGGEAASLARRRDLERRRADDVGLYEFGQFLVHEQHRRLRAEIAPWGLGLFGDLQVGMGGRDAWALQPLLLPGYLLGAPPSRTNPLGQPWGYPLLDPERCAPHGAGLGFLASRVDKMLAEHDGLRIDHPHGLVCPWVYRADDADGYRAVQHGARLFSSPDLADHPALARYAIARADQIDRARPRHDDRWVTDLTDDQVARHAVLLDTIVSRARHYGRDVSDLLCEVLSTWPYPLRRAMERHGLGRFCVTQKVDPDDPHDLYRSELCRPQDWIMVGNHDTPPVWHLVEQWHGSARAEARARYLAARLSPDPARRPELAAALARDPLRMAEAMFADLFVGPARNVSIFFADLLGMKETYNVPGDTGAGNWTLRVPPDYARVYHDRVSRREALDLPSVLRLALEARGLL